MENKTDTTAEEDYRDHLRIENPEDPYNGNPEEEYVMRGEDEKDKRIEALEKKLASLTEEKKKLYWEKIKLQAIIERMCLNIK